MSEDKPSAPQTSYKRTHLYSLHRAQAARMAPFAGYEMPIQYRMGVLKEHLHTRASAGLFDVSHMGQLALRPKSGDVADVALALERLVPVDILSLKPGRQRYGFFTNERGGILDDFMVANRGDHMVLIVNANRKHADEAHLRTSLSEEIDIQRLDRALIAVQGPKSESVVARFNPDFAQMRFMDMRTMTILDAECVVSRSGYTGEDGFEISIPSERAHDLAEAILEDDRVAPVGLGARDSLRLEAGMCLYGSDIDETTTPIEATLKWAIQQSRRPGGVRAGGFPGAKVIQEQAVTGPSRIRVGFLPVGRAPVRAGAALFETESATDPIGHVTSGGFGPSVEHPVAMGYVPSSCAMPGTVVCAEVRGKRLPMTVTALPFITPKYKRG